MACGLPVVASPVNGIPDLVPAGKQSGGVLIEAGNVETLVREMKVLLDDPDLALELGRRARHHAEKNFTKEALGRQLRELLLPERISAARERELPVAV
jgi:glycosyltransferase involved in cell wall biosynthesis